MAQVRWRLILIVGFFLLSVLLLLPTLMLMGDVPEGEPPKTLPDWWASSKMLPTQRLSLGLDLRGGVHMVYEVKVDEAAEAEVRHLAEFVEDQLKTDKVRVESSEPTEDLEIEVRFRKEEGSLDSLERILNRYDYLELDRSRSKGKRAIVIPHEQLLRERRDAAVDQAVEVIRNRIDELGVAEPTIQRLDTGLELTGAASSPRILVQLPGLKDPSEAKRLVQSTAQLEFKLVDATGQAECADLLARLANFPNVEDESARKVDQTLGPCLPRGSAWHFQVERDTVTRNITRAFPVIVKDKTELTGAHLEDARVSFGQFNTPEVAFEFDKEGARKFAKLTRDNRGEQLAIVLDGKVYSAPVIRSAITGGRGVIEGNFDAAEARNLAIVLRAGALPASLELLEERSVGPELGSKSVRQGQISILLGGLLVIIFMAVYYRQAGVIADISLALNLLFLLAVLAGIRATLTLPGIAGIILTVGMAVDANVIIFERIREEMRAGKSPRAAVDAGYEKALSTILDANITTVIAALVLFQFGTGPVRGFAITLTIGVITSVFCALVVTRTAFDYLSSTRKLKTLSI